MPTPPSEPTKLPSDTTVLAEQLKKKLEEHRAIIAKERDALREILAEYEELVGDLDEADTSLGDAVDALSRLQ